MGWNFVTFRKGHWEDPCPFHVDRTVQCMMLSTCIVIFDPWEAGLGQDNPGSLAFLSFRVLHLKSLPPQAKFRLYLGPH